MRKVPPDKHAPDSSTDRVAIRAQIDENLRRAYDQVLTEDVPDRFRELLAKLQAGEVGK